MVLLSLLLTLSKNAILLKDTLSLISAGLVVHLAIWETLFSLGLIESTDKVFPPSTRMVCLGVELDTNALTLSVSCEGLEELECLLAHWLTKKTTTKSALQSLVGKLVFISKCVRQSRVFISRILSRLRTIKFNHHQVNLNAEFRKGHRLVVSFSPELQWCLYDQYHLVVVTWGGFYDRCMFYRLWGPLRRRVFSFRFSGLYIVSTSGHQLPRTFDYHYCATCHVGKALV